MNILFINNFECSPDISGGVNRVIYVLTRHFTEDLGYNCFFGFFDNIPSDKRPAKFAGRIRLSSPLKEDEFKKFLVDNHIDIVSGTRAHIRSSHHNITGSAANDDIVVGKRRK